MNGFPTAKLAGILLALMSSVIGTDAGSAAELTDEEWRELYESARNRKRRVIWNNDSCDMWDVPRELPLEPASALQPRMSHVPESSIDTVFYCPLHAGFSHVNYPTKFGSRWKKPWNPHAKNAQRGNQFHEDFNVFLLRRNVDVVKMFLDFSRKHGREFFYSMRMNDTHDHGSKPGFPDADLWSALFSEFKRNNRRLLMNNQPGGYKDLPHARWSAVDYSHAEVRDLAFNLLAEACTNYELDGIELDFNREPFIFRSVAMGEPVSDRQIELMNDLISRIKEMTVRIGRRRGRPILIAVRLPDSLEYCRRLGLDIEHWMKQGWIDIFVGGNDFFRFNRVADMVAVCAKHGVRYYAPVEEPRVRTRFLCRYGTRSHLARAAAAMSAGASGTYHFNLYSPLDFRSNIRNSPEHLVGRNKVYFASYYGYSPERYLRNSHHLLNLPQISPRSQNGITAAGLHLPLEMGENFQAATAQGRKPRVRCWLIIRDGDSFSIDLAVNGRRQKFVGRNRHMHLFNLEADDLREGVNNFEMKLAGSEAARMTTVFKGDRIIRYGKEQGFRASFRRLFDVENFAASERIVDGAYRLEDSGAGQKMSNLIFPLPVADPNLELEFETRLEQSDRPTAACIRVANGHHVEVVTFRKDRVALRFAGVAAEFDPTRFHSYAMRFHRNKVTLSVDGRKLLTGPLKMQATAREAELKHHTDTIAHMHDRSIVFGSLSGPGRGASLWRNLRLRMPAIISDFAVTVDYPADVERAAQTIETWDSAYSPDANGWRRNGGRQTGDALELRFSEQHTESLTSPLLPGGLKNATLVAEAEMVLNHGAVALTVSNGQGFATYLIEEFGGSVPFYSTADSRRVILTTQPHRYRIETRNGEGRVYVDGQLYSDINLPMPLTPLDRAGTLFSPEEIVVLKRGGLFIKAINPNHHFVNRPSGSETSAVIRSARFTHAN